MKTGYSILLGEYIAADHATHADTSGFQIVCPCCKDPVFKVERLGGADITEYFAHYKAKLDNAECELRVAGISQKEQGSRNASSRGQTLKVFLSVFRDAVGVKWDDEHRRIMRNLYADCPGLKTLASLFSDGLARGIFLNEQRAGVRLDMICDTADQSRIANETGLALSFRRRVVEDLLAHLRAPHAAKNRDFLGLLFVTNMVEQATKERAAGVQTPRLHEVLTIALGGGNMSMVEYIERARTNQKMTDALLYNIETGEQIVIQTMVQLPYLRMIKNHREGKPPMAGITGFDPLPWQESKYAEMLAIRQAAQVPIDDAMTIPESP